MTSTCVIVVVCIKGFRGLEYCLHIRFRVSTRVTMVPVITHEHGLRVWCMCVCRRRERARRDAKYANNARVPAISDLFTASILPFCAPVVRTQLNLLYYNIVRVCFFFAASANPSRAPYSIWGCSRWSWIYVRTEISVVRIRKTNIYICTVNNILYTWRIPLAAAHNYIILLLLHVVKHIIIILRIRMGKLVLKLPKPTVLLTYFFNLWKLVLSRAYIEKKKLCRS